ncbi:PDR/VanB family oxidoreductase [Actinomadura sp. NEAU-AAG7]|uniref:PDR/VanB family oxidoreductase n=1 Tax=Actinomadura sp. NEAU-AAG7 TaxID=2839640 RepID=UPI001BE3F422|nr:PDR/VanB family oxidoreductase [Actinomadura sp. NEAU-AAG7]MBT2212259.1 PDR/VanB family oxidoreductase [Actinomadura sp. NEAU-AAG7]
MMTREGGRLLTVTGIDRPARDIVALHLADPAGGPLPEWEPGAHIDVQLITRHLRQYSLCGSPDDRTGYRIAVLRERLSRGASAYVHSYLDVGKKVRVWEPRNHFGLRPAERYVFLAAGIGITPILPMVMRAREAGVPWRLAYSVRTLEEAAFRDELAGLGEAVTLRATGTGGRLDLGRFVGDFREGTGVYCCGSPGFVEAAEKAVAGWPEGSFHAERFVPVPRDFGPSEPFVAVCARSDVRVRVDAGVGLLAALRREGVRVAGGCLKGVCGSCAVTVLDGVPQHRDSLLGPGTLDRMHACVSRAATPEIVLDV